MTAQSIPSPSPLTTALVRLGRQLLLVPEALILVLLLSFYQRWGNNLSLGVLALFVALWFGLRMALLLGARHAFDAGRYVRAESLAHWAVSLYPYSADALGLLGMTQLTAGRTGPAIANLRRALSYYPAQPWVYTALATGLLEAGATSEARTAALAALAYDPAYGPAYLPLAEAETRLGSNPAQIEALLRQGLVCPLASGDAAALSCALAARCLQRGAAEEARNAISHAEELLATTPVHQRAGLHFQLGELWQSLDHRDAARSHFAASADLDPEGPHAATAWRAART